MAVLLKCHFVCESYIVVGTRPQVEPTATVLDIKALFHKSCKFNSMLLVKCNKVKCVTFCAVTDTLYVHRSKVVPGQTVPAFGPQ